MLLTNANVFREDKLITVRKSFLQIKFTPRHVFDSFAKMRLTLSLMRKKMLFSRYILHRICIVPINGKATIWEIGFHVLSFSFQHNSEYLWWPHFLLVEYLANLFTFSYTFSYTWDVGCYVYKIALTKKNLISVVNEVKALQCLNHETVTWLHGCKICNYVSLS